MKKIIIFTSHGGGGHISVSNALEKYLNTDYEVYSIPIFTEILHAIDPIQVISSKKNNGERMYNFLMRKKQFLLLNLIYSIGYRYFNFLHKKIYILITAYLQKYKPDLIISVIPIINNIVLEAAHHLNIPLILIPTDLDATTFINGIHKPTYNNFITALSFNDSTIMQTLTSAQLSEKNLVTTGFPIRPDFFENKNKDNIKHFYNIPHNKPIILLIMGAQGTQSMYIFAQQLKKLSFDAHLIFCVGKNKTIGPKIKALSFPPHITYTIVEFTERISDLMAIAEILITKSGTVSVCEAIYTNLPLLLDATSTVLTWEQFNHQFIKNHNFGDLITNTNTIALKVTEFFYDKNKYSAMKESLLHFQKKNPITEITHIINTLIN